MDISKVQELVPVIMETYTDMSEKNNWIEVPKETKEITIYVKAKHTDTMLFWLVPTGTATWEERQLIGYDINGADGWSLKWNVSGKMLHHHICVQALGVTSISSDLINVHTEYK
ncbi:hypothetical protein BAGA_10380 [Bacillus gaemokensis]|uniref:Uncharacterized protein n=1 Tax=Bacillus gaemokensis TaxID=574375 RepID=A0A073K9L9_9BACI|nr:hypothetical protein BAGA_10380 [Bacillus gaemokensis]